MRTVCCLRKPVAESYQGHATWMLLPPLMDTSLCFQYHLGLVYTRTAVIVFCHRNPLSVHSES